MADLPIKAFLLFCGFVALTAAVVGIALGLVCGRTLRNALSRSRGVGPECWGKAEAGRALSALRSAGFDVLDQEDEPDA